MSRPVVSQSAEDLYEILKPLAFADSLYDYPLLKMCEATVGRIQLVRDYGTDWSIVVNIDTTPEAALPWLAQFVGVTIPPEMLANAMREYVKATPGFKRGSPGAMVAQVQQLLTGNKTVIFRERWGGAYFLSVRTYINETPSEANVLDALMAQKPAGIILDYDAVAGQEWQQLFEDHATWQAVFTTYSDWQEVIEDT